MLDKFHAALKQHGRSVTRSRTLLFEYLQANEAVTFKQFVKDNLKIADQASLYRCLQLFRELGVIEERYATGKKLIELSDHYDTHHHHATCLRCGLVTPLHEDSELEAWIDKVAARENFASDSHQLEIRGYCSNCQPVKS